MVEMGLPEYYGKKGLLSLQDYKQILIKSREDVGKFIGVTGMLRGQLIVELLDDDFFLLWKLRNLFVSPPTYERYIEVEISYKRMMTFKYPTKQDWDQLLQLQ
jgi:hypothetical protein